MAISESLYERLLKMNKQALFNLMLESIEEMQSYNGQSTTSAIMRSMSADETSTDNGVTSWKVPSTSELNKNWKENFPLSIE